MTGADHAAPMVAGYLREHFMMTAAELARVRDQLIRFTAAEGFTLRGIYVEKLETEPAAFHGLIDAARHGEVSAVVVPSLDHLEPRTGGRSRRRHLQCVGVRVLVAEPTPP